MFVKLSGVMYPATSSQLQSVLFLLKYTTVTWSFLFVWYTHAFLAFLRFPGILVFFCMIAFPFPSLHTIILQCFFFTTMWILFLNNAQAVRLIWFCRIIMSSYVIVHQSFSVFYYNVNFISYYSGGGGGSQGPLFEYSAYVETT